MLPVALPDHIRSRLTDYAQLLRIDRPIGTLLLLWPTYWALWLAGDGSPGIGNIIVFTLGVFFMRAAGCAINDFADRHWDKHVERTKDRPLTTGRVKAWEAVALFGGLCMVSFLMVVLFTNTLTLYLSFGGAVLAFIYPFTKRYTHLPQLFLGAAFSWAIPWHGPPKPANSAKSLGYYSPPTCSGPWLTTLCMPWLIETTTQR